MTQVIKVAIFGAGIGGLTVAHELAERSDQFAITVYEKSNVCGGKARSIITAQGFPGEHSVRTVHRVYYHLRDTLRRIPYENNAGNALGNIVPTAGGPRKFFMVKDHDGFVLPHFFPWGLQGLREYRAYIKAVRELVPKSELDDFLKKIIKIACVCEERRKEIYDHISWDDFLQTKNKSAAFRSCLARLPEFYVAGRGTARASTMGMLLARAILYPLIHPFDSQRSASDVFNGPSSEVFINPWMKYLSQKNVVFQMNAAAKQVWIADGKVSGVNIINSAGEEELIVADIYVFAVPLEVMTVIAKDPALKTAIPSLAGLDQLRVEPSSGLQYFNIDDNAGIFPRGWTSFLDSPWAIIGLYQSPLIWDKKYFKSPVKGVLSIAWSNFDEPGVIYNKPAYQCTAEEMKNEVLAQIKLHKGADKFIAGLNYCDWNMDPSIVFSGPDGVMLRHQEPLFVPYPDSRQYQPHAYTEADNLFLAADYVQTGFDITTMESANEAGRRAVNAIIKQKQYTFKPCYLLDTNKTGLSYVQALDKILYRFSKNSRMVK